VSALSPDTVGPPAWLAPTPKRSPSGHSLTPAEAGRMIHQACEMIPITRMHDLQPLGLLDVPTWAAVTPLLQDLTVHLGKGESSELAWLSAAFEAVERFCGERLPLAAHDSPNPEMESRQACALLALDNAFSDDFRDGRWVDAWDLIQEAWVRLPEAAVVSPSMLGNELRAHTNGLAAGGTMVEAVVHAIYELIERDATTVAELSRDFAREDPGILRVDPASLGGTVQRAATRIQSSGAELSLLELRGIAGVPVYEAHLRDADFPGFAGEAVELVGAGACLDPSIAALRAVLEAGQAHAGLFLGSREGFEGLDDENPPTERPEALVRRTRIFTEVPRINSAHEFDKFSDLLEELQELVGRLRTSGLKHLFVADLTNDAISIPVARVIGPDLASPLGSWIADVPLRALKGILRS